MLKFIKMDFYRVSRQKSTFIFLAIVVGIVLMTLGATRLEQELLNSDLLTAEETQIFTSTMEMTDSADSGILAGGIGMNVNPSLEWMDPDSEVPVFEFAEQPLKGGMIAILIMVYAVIFGYAERRNGYIKNLVGEKHFKAKLLLSKMSVVAVFTAVVFLVLYLAMMLFAPLIMMNSISYSISGDMFLAIIAQYAVHLALGAFTLLLTIIFEGTTLPIVIGTLLSMGIFGLLYNLINSLILKLFDKVVSVANYLPSGQLRLMNGGAADGDISRGFIVAGVFIVLYLILACFIAEKKDVK